MLAAGAALTLAPQRALAQTENPPLPCSAALNDSSAPIFYAEAMGYYKSAGLNVTLNFMNSAAPALASGALVIAGLPTTVVATAREKGVPFVMIAPLSLYVSTTPDHALVVLKDAPYHSAADLNGKTIGTRDLGNMSYFAARAWMDKNGGDSKSVHWYELSDPLDLAAMKSGRLDAASISEPALTPALRSGDVRVLAPVFDAIAPRFLVAACVTTDAFVKARPDIVRKFADVIAKTSKWANANQTQSGVILEKYTQTPVPPGAARALYGDRLRVAEVQPVLDLMLATGQIKSAQRAGDLFSSVVATS
ncbi:MAG TPA: ABC transporter substrate-binding protein [Candidatus Lustribacter sp.]|nr:ABC transporter substrate-binding protein [Candidatus Lustribacter sp.]